MFAVPQHFTGCRRHRLKRFDRRFCFALLENAQNSVQKDDRQNDDDVCKALVRQCAGYTGNHRRRHQDDQHRVFELFEKSAQHGRLLCGLQFVRAMLRQTFLRVFC